MTHSFENNMAKLVITVCFEHPSAQAGGSKRRIPSDPSQPVRKRTKKTAQPMDEDTMVALALSRSLLDQEVEMERAKTVKVTEVKGAEPQISVGTALQWKATGGEYSSALLS